MNIDSQTHVTLDTYADTVLDHIPAGVALFDARDLRLLAANKLFYRFFETYHIPSCDAETCIGHTLSEGLSATDAADAAALIAIFRSVAETGIPYQTEESTAPVLHRDQMDWGWSLHPICNEHGQIIQLIFHGSETTAHQQAEQAHTSLTHAYSTSEMARKRPEVIEIERQKNAFLALASHELRTPLTAIMGFAEILQLKDAKEEGLDPLSRRAISQIVAQSDHMTRLIDAMFDLTRLENAELSLDCDMHNLQATLKEAMASQEITARDLSIRLVAKDLAVSGMVRGFFDKQRVMHIMNNVISNAIKYSPPGSDIEVGLQRSQQQPDEALIWVRDQGIGIPKDEVQLIFQRFYRASNLEKSMSGLGLGLYLVQDLVRRHGGRVWVESTEGEGSTFYILLPLKKERH